MFQNLRANSQLFILHKESSPYIELGSVANVSAPKPKYPAVSPIGQYPQVEMVVDVSVNINGQTTNFQGLPAGADIADFGVNGNIVVSCSRDAINSEVATMRQKSVDILNSADYHRNVIAACDKMIQDLNPELAAKQQQEKEIAGIKKQMSEMKNEFSDFMNMLKEQLGIAERKKEK